MKTYGGLTISKGITVSVLAKWVGEASVSNNYLALVDFAWLQFSRQTTRRQKEGVKLVPLWITTEFWNKENHLRWKWKGNTSKRQNRFEKIKWYPWSLWAKKINNVVDVVYPTITVIVGWEKRRSRLSQLMRK